MRKYAASLGFDNPTREQRAVLARRLSFEEGLEEPPSIPILALPVESRAALQKVYVGFQLLVACRWAVAPGSPVVFTRWFAARWCQVSEDQAREATHELHRLGFLIRLPEKHDRAWQWLPAGTS